MLELIKIPEMVELQGKLKHTNERMAKAFEEAKVERDGTTVHDFSQVKVYGEGLSTTAVAEKVRADTAEQNDLGAQIDAMRELQLAAQKSAEPVKGLKHPGGNQGGPNAGGGQPEYKSIGQQIVEHPIFKQWSATPGRTKQGVINLDVPGLEWIKGTKTLFQTSAGWAPESLRTGTVIEDAQRPIQIIDLIPPGTTGMAAVVYMEETTFTSAAAERNEGAAYAESTLALTERSSTVRSIGTSLPVTDEQLEDVAGVQSYLDNRMRFMVRQRLDGQLLTGDGAAPNLEGILNVSGIQTQAKAADPTPDAFFKAMTLVEATGRAQPTGHIIHPTDWQDIRILRTTDGIYIWGNPSEAGPMRLWGLPVTTSTAITQNTGLVGAFSPYSQLFERRGLTVEIGFDSDDFTKGIQTLRAGVRVAFVVYRPAAFCTVTGI